MLKPLGAEALLDAHTGDGSGNDQLLDLTRAFKNGMNLGVTVHPLDVVLTGVAVPAEDLYCVFGHAYCHL